MRRGTYNLTIRNVPGPVVKGLKALARQRNKSMEQTVREILEQQVMDRAAVIRMIEASWEQQLRRPTAEEVDSWIRSSRDQSDDQ